MPAGKHKLSVIFIPKDEAKQAEAQASVTLIVEELPNVDSLLRATSQTPIDPGVNGQRVAPGTGNVTPADTTEMQDQDVSPAKKKWPMIAPAAWALLKNSKNSAGSNGFWKTFRRPAEPTIAPRDDQPAQNPQRETRLYKGAVYAKGDDGQWHLERK